MAAADAVVAANLLQFDDQMQRLEATRTRACLDSGGPLEERTRADGLYADELH